MFLTHSIMHGQTKIDHVVSIQFPGKAELVEQKQAKTYVKGYYLNNKKESFIFIRSVPTKKDSSELRIYSKSIKGLLKRYKYTSKLLIKEFEKKSFKLSDSSMTSVYDFKAYRLRFKDKLEAKNTAECLIIDLNGIQYYGIYAMVTEFSEKRKSNFFNSLKIHDPEKQKQIVKPSIMDLLFRKD